MHSAPSAPRPSAPPSLVVTCEHAANAVPARWSRLFDTPAAQAALRSHRGWDPGAADLARSLAAAGTAPCFLGTATRLLVELNRSAQRPQLWSEFSRELSAPDKESILSEFYHPFRNDVRRAIERLPAPVFHLSVHSFAPELDGRVRTAEIGLLYDPARPLEVHWANAWTDALRRHAPGWRIRHNYPYLGIDDGHTSFLRADLPPHSYAGLELEINQALVSDADLLLQSRQRLLRALAETTAISP